MSAAHTLWKAIVVELNLREQILQSLEIPLEFLKDALEKEGGKKQKDEKLIYILK